MNLREAGAQGARRLTAAITVVAAALASIIGVSVWVGTAAAAQSTANTSVNDHQRVGDDDGFGGFVSPGQGGGGHANSNGS
jgi:nitrous oxide reductase